MPTNNAPQPEKAPPGAAEIIQRLEAHLNLQRLTDDRQSAGQASDPLHDVRSRQWVNSHLPIGWPHWPKGLGPKLSALLKKITRRLLRWYIVPLVDQQNEFNEAAVLALQDAHHRMDRDAAAIRSTRDDLALAVQRMAAAEVLQAAAPSAPERSPRLAAALELLAPPPSPRLDATRHDVLLRRLLLAQQLTSTADSLPLLIIASDQELAERARHLGLAVESCCAGQRAPTDGGATNGLCESLHDQLAGRPPRSLAGLFWIGGQWQCAPVPLLQLLSVASRALAPNAPLVIESVDPADSAALDRYVWADPLAVRPYARALLTALLRAAGLVEIATLTPPTASADASAWFTVIGYRDHE